MSETSERPEIRLVIADVDGTLVTKEKVLTPRSIEAVHRLYRAGIAFAITTGRPPLGVKMLLDALELKTPIAAFNGGMFVRPDLTVISQLVLPEEIATRVVGSLEAHGLDVWIFRGADWYVRQLHGPHVDREGHTTHVAPTVVAGFEHLFDNVVKMVGVSDDLDAVARCTADVQREYGGQVSARQSQPYYLDVTHLCANKGEVVTRLSEMLGVPTGQIASIGDGPNDVLMFERTRVSIAMGNARPEVQAAAAYVTTSNEEEGFALAMERCVLGLVPTGAPSA